MKGKACGKPVRSKVALEEGALRLALPGGAGTRCPDVHDARAGDRVVREVQETRRRERLHGGGGFESQGQQSHEKREGQPVWQPLVGPP